MDDDQIISASNEYRHQPSSNTGLLIIIFVLLLILVAGGAFLFGANQNTDEEIVVLPSPTSVVTPTEVLGITATPTATPTPSFRVTSVAAAVAPSEASVCPSTFNFSAMITASDEGLVKYQWVKSDGSNPTTETVEFTGPGSKTVKSTWKIYESLSGSQKLVIVSPNALASNEASFTLNCPVVEPIFKLPTGNLKINP